jgi:hypothetical protein
MIDKLTEEIELAVKEFIDSLPAVQKKIYASLLKETRQLTLYADGTVKNNYENIRRIARIKKTLDDIIFNKTYLTKVSGFIDAFAAVEKIQNNYFAKLSSEFSPMKVLEEVKKQAIEDTVSALTETGIGANITAPIKEILKTNITAGGSYAELTEQLRNKILGNADVDGSLVKYSGQITTDSINQYSATYTKAITDDLGLTWFRYTGSLLRTSRPFCKELVKLSYVHVSQFPDLIHGHIGDVTVPLGKDGLPNGMNENTTAANFPILRGGYNCGHQLIPISTESVPKALRDQYE